MTWDQFVAVALGIIATAMVRLLDKYLPRSGGHPHVEAAVAEGTTPAPTPEPPAQPIDPSTGTVED